MRPGFGSAKCYVCRKTYAVESMGRMRLPLFTNEKSPYYFRIVCEVCAGAILDSWPPGIPERPPLYHGF